MVREGLTSEPFPPSRISIKFFIFSVTNYQITYTLTSSPFRTPTETEWSSIYPPTTTVRPSTCVVSPPVVLKPKVGRFTLYDHHKDYPLRSSANLYDSTSRRIFLSSVLVYFSLISVFTHM